MRVRTAREGGIVHTGELQIVDVVADPLDQPRVFFALEGLANKSVGHEGLPIAEFANASALARAHLFGSVLHRFYDVLVTGATAEVPGKGAANLGFLRIFVSLQQINSRQDHSRRAIATLEAVFFPEAFLHGMQGAVACAGAITDAITGAVSSALLGIRRKPFDCGDL